MDQIRVGSSTLAKYTYSEDANRYLLHMDYGNGDYRTYGYDSYGRDNRIIGSENRREGSQIAGETYRYDGLNRLIGSCNW